MKIAKGKAEWFPRQADPVGAETPSSQRGGKAKRKNVGIAFKVKSKPGRKAKRYSRGSDSQQYDFNRKVKAEIN